MSELTLRNYRANPSNRNFAAVARDYESWVYSRGMSTLRRFPTLSPTSVLDDVANEGLLEISRSARRFVWFCGRCGDAFGASRAPSAPQSAQSADGPDRPAQSGIRNLPSARQS